MLHVYARSRMMIKFVEDHERLFEHIAVKNRNSFGFSVITPKCSHFMFFWQSHFQSGHTNTVMLSKSFESLFCLPVRDEPNDDSFELLFFQFCSRTSLCHRTTNTLRQSAQAQKQKGPAHTKAICSTKSLLASYVVYDSSS